MECKRLYNGKDTCEMLEICKLCYIRELCRRLTQVGLAKQANSSKVQAETSVKKDQIQNFEDLGWIWKGIENAPDVT